MPNAHTEPIWRLPSDLRRQRFQFHQGEVVPFDLLPGRTLMRSDKHVIGFSSTGARLMQRIEADPPRQILMPPASFVFLPAGTLQATANNERSSGTLLLVEDDALRTIAHETIDPNSIDLRPLDPVVSSIGFQAACMLERMVSEGRAGDWPVLTEQLVAKVAFSVLRALVQERGPEPFPKGLPSGRLRRVLDYVAENYSRKVTLAQLAGVSALSVYHFSRSFRKATGVTPVRYLWRYRIQVAARMLRRRPEMPLSQVAHACGFSGQSHFSDLFKREMGKTPATYRAEHSIRVHLVL